MFSLRVVTAVQTPVFSIRCTSSGLFCPVVSQVVCATATSGVRNLIWVSVIVIWLSLKNDASACACACFVSVRPLNQRPMTSTKSISSANNVAKCSASLAFHASANVVIIALITASSFVLVSVVDIMIVLTNDLY